jgi:hypothetical protein
LQLSACAAAHALPHGLHSVGWWQRLVAWPGLEPCCVASHL